MTIFVVAKPKSREEKVEKLSENTFEVRVKEPAIENKANRAIVKALAAYFKIPQSRVRMVSRHNSKKKILEING